MATVFGMSRHSPQRWEAPDRLISSLLPWVKAVVAWAGVVWISTSFAVLAQQCLYCATNGKYYQDVGRCIEECKVTLGHFTGICTPVEQGCSPAGGGLAGPQAGLRPFRGSREQSSELSLGEPSWVLVGLFALGAIGLGALLGPALFGLGELAGVFGASAGEIGEAGAVVELGMGEFGEGLAEGAAGVGEVGAGAEGAAGAGEVGAGAEGAAGAGEVGTGAEGAAGAGEVGAGAEGAAGVGEVGTGAEGAAGVGEVGAGAEGAAGVGETGEVTEGAADGPQSVVDIVSPDGQYVGDAVGGATENIRTVTPQEFAQIEQDLMNLKPTPGGTYASGSGQWYDLPDGTRFGIRQSSSGPTIDFDNPNLPPGLKIHQQ
jgi:hypothetical protein